MALFDYILQHLQNQRREQIEALVTHPRNVVFVGHVLGVSEFEVFRIAYRQWYGADADDRLIQGVFKPYVFTSETPFWVTHFCKTVTTLYQAGELDVRAFTGHETPEDRRSRNTLIA